MCPRNFMAYDQEDFLHYYAERRAYFDSEYKKRTKSERLYCGSQSQEIALSLT